MHRTQRTFRAIGVWWPNQQTKLHPCKADPTVLRDALLHILLCSDAQTQAECVAGRMLTCMKPTPHLQLLSITTIDRGTLIDHDTLGAAKSNTVCGSICSAGTTALPQHYISLQVPLWSQQLMLGQQAEHVLLRLLALTTKCCAHFDWPLEAPQTPLLNTPNQVYHQVPYGVPLRRTYNETKEVMELHSLGSVPLRLLLHRPLQVGRARTSEGAVRAWLYRA
jgi:hypothetical protein